MARTPNNGPSMSGTRPRYSLNGSSGGGSGMSSEMLNRMFPDSIWKYGTLTEPQEEEIYQFEAEPVNRFKRKLRRKPIEKKPQKRRLSIRVKASKKQRRRKLRAVTKVKRLRPKRAATKVLTVSEYILFQKASTLQRKRQLEQAERMKARAMVKVRQARLKRLLSEIHLSAARHVNVKKPKAITKRKMGAANNVKLKHEIRKWQICIDKIRTEEAAYRKGLKKAKDANPPKRVAPPPAAKYRCS